MTFEGAIVKVVAELMPFSGGLKRNIVQCLDTTAFRSSSPTQLWTSEGKERVSAGANIAEVGPDMKPILERKRDIPASTASFHRSDPENELSRNAGVSINPVTNGPVVNEILDTSIPVFGMRQRSACT